MGEPLEDHRALVREPLPLLDGLRVLASFAVTWHHLRNGDALGIAFGMVLFLLMMTGLAASSTRVEGWLPFARRKAAYMLGPWLRWSLIYGLLHLAIDPLIVGRSGLERLEPAMLLYGTRIELWFLPFALGLLILVQRLTPVLNSFAPERVVACAAIVAALTPSLCEIIHPIAPRPLDEWLTGASALPLGIGFGQCLRMHDRPRRRAWLAALVCITSGAYVVSPLAAHGEDLVRRYAVAGAFAALGFGWRPALPAPLRFAARHTFGIYLIHPLCAGLAGAWIDTQALPALVHVGGVWCASLGAVALLGKLPLTWPECPRTRDVRNEAHPRTGTDVATDAAAPRRSRPAA